VLIDWTGEFDRWYDRLVEHAEAGDERALDQLALVEAELEVLQDLQAAPESDTPTLKRVAQSRRYPVWRVAHPFVDGTAMRLIVWFPPQRPGQAVVVLFGVDKAQMGDVFYHSVGPRADVAIESYLFRIRSEGETDE
jgi:hypothetical protein